MPKLLENQAIPLDFQAQNSEKETYIEEVIRDGLRQAYESELPDMSTIRVTEYQEKRAEELRKALGLAFGVVLNTAIKYALFQAKREGITVNQFEEYPNHLGSHSLELKVTAETLYKLKEAGMTHKLSECVVVGIQLLYERLIETQYK